MTNGSLRTLLQSRDCISTKLYGILIRAIMARHIFAYKNKDFINGQIDNHALANRAFIPGRNPELDQYWSESQFMAHGPRGSLHMTISRGPDNWAREFANERLHHGPVDDRKPTVSSTAGLPVLNVIRREKLQENAHIFGTYLKERLISLKDKHESNGYSLKDKNKAKIDKTEHENGKSMKDRSQRHVHLKWANPHPFNGPGQPTKP
ncbi:peroxisome biogenesis protein 5 [Tanacetum coccineum]|uniref:Peroxisome biogenesis protein 5 n=1 Tax=Tanacetum coccineum TaxID=301880 RepID=A0ABQ5GA10_9ASTR